MILIALPEKCPYSEFFWSICSRIWTEYWEIWSIFPYSVRMRENTDQKNSEHGHFLRSVEVRLFRTLSNINDGTLSKNSQGLLRIYYS